MSVEHVADAVTSHEADDLVAHLESLFADVVPKDRPRFPLRGRTASFHRDALWHARPADDGFLPLYRVYNTAYKDPDRTTGIAAARPPEPMTEPIRRVLDALSAAHSLPVLNHAVLHRYVDGDDYISYHKDKWMDLDPASTIVSLSLGATRTFRLRKPSVGASPPATRALRVAHRDLVLLPCSENRKWKHTITKERGCAGVRYSITARTVDTFFDPLTRRYRTRHTRGEARPY